MPPFRLVLVLLFGLSQAIALAGDPVVDKVEPLLRQVIAERYPELHSYKVVLRTFESGEDFFRAAPDGIFSAPKDRTYVVEVNARLLKNYPGDDAVKGILTHELSHVLDYTRMSGSQIVALGAQYAYHDASRALVAYERKSDRIAVKRGAGKELAAYRRWLYRNVSEEIRGKKQKVYCAPEELEQGNLAESPEADELFGDVVETDEQKIAQWLLGGLSLGLAYRLGHGTQLLKKIGHAYEDLVAKGKFRTKAERDAAVARVAQAGRAIGPAPGGCGPRLSLLIAGALTADAGYRVLLLTATDRDPKVSPTASTLSFFARKFLP